MIEEKIGFFKRIWISVFKLEDYGLFLGEKFKTALKYFFILVLLCSIVLAGIEFYSLYNMANTAVKYITDELPDFEYADGNVKFEEKVEAYDQEYDFKLFIDTDDITETQISDYKDKLANYTMGFLIMNDKIIYSTLGSNVEYSYTEIAQNFNLEVSNKEDLTTSISEKNLFSVCLVLVVTSVGIIYFANLISIFENVIIITLLGIISARICGLKFKTLPMMSLAIYSITLSVILNTIYNVSYAVFEFEIANFDFMCLLISYIYILAAILLIKYDLVKQHVEVEKISEIQRKIHEEIEKIDEEDLKKQDKPEEEPDKKESNENDSDKKEKKEENTPKEPDGSEI